MCSLRWTVVAMGLFLPLFYSTWITFWFAVAISTYVSCWAILYSSRQHITLWTPLLSNHTHTHTQCKNVDWYNVMFITKVLLNDRNMDSYFSWCTGQVVAILHLSMVSLTKPHFVATNYLNYRIPTSTLIHFSNQKKGDGEMLEYDIWF